MSLDTKIRAAVKRTIRQIGTLVTVQRITVGTYNLLTRTVTNAEADHEVYGRLDEYTEREMVNTSIRAGDRRLTVAASELTFVPVPTDRVVVADETFDIVRVQQEMAQHEPAMYVMQLRK